jgi:hypothetical protein
VVKMAHSERRRDVALGRLAPADEMGKRWVHHHSGSLFNKISVTSRPSSRFQLVDARTQVAMFKYRCDAMGSNAMERNSCRRR